MSLRLPASTHNPISAVGAAIVTAMAMLFLVLFALELFGYLTNPYIGLLVFVAVPVIFIVGLLLIPFGIWWSARRRRLDPGAAEWPVIDLRIPRQRTILATVLALTFVNVLIVSLGAFGSIHYMESSAFCGQVCHTTMEPQAVAHQAWPHARVECTQCHVGPGAGAFVEAKMAGTQQLFQIMTDRVPTPVPPPDRLILPASATCQQCHWPEQFHGDEVRVIREYSNDEKNTETVTTLQLHVGGGSARLGIGTGIHWHMNLDNEIEFVTTGSKRESIPYVRLTDRQGNVREYFAKGTTAAQVASGTRWKMDCIDCHSRPAHTFEPTPERAVDNAIARGRIPRDLPFVRREAAAAVTVRYPTRAEALAAIERRLREFYKARGTTDASMVDRAVTGSQEVWAGNVFPAMKVTWGTYVNQLGHIDGPGCFRCHDDEHRTQDGKVIGQDCELCHSMPGG